MVFENYVADIEVDGEQAELALWNTGGQEEIDQVYNPGSMRATSIILKSQT